MWVQKNSHSPKDWHTSWTLKGIGASQWLLSRSWNLRNEMLWLLELHLGRIILNPFWMRCWRRSSKWVRRSAWELEWSNKSLMQTTTFLRLHMMVSMRRWKLALAHMRPIGVVTHWYCPWVGIVKVVYGRACKSCTNQMPPSFLVTAKMGLLNWLWASWIIPIFNHLAVRHQYLDTLFLRNTFT